MAFCSSGDLDHLVLVSRFDPAIDAKQSDLDAYVADYAYDTRHLCFVEGQAPSVFHCRPLSHRLLSRILDRMMPGEADGKVEIRVHEAALLAFRWAVTDIENMPEFDAQRDIQPGNPPAIRERWLDDCCLPLDVIIEIGSVILARARLSGGARKN